MSLTKRQLDVLYFIHKHTLNHNGVAPSYDEIKDGIGLKSKNGINRLICALEERGYIRRHPHKARSIHILRMPGTNDGWQPIETAPEDEECLIVFDEPFFGRMCKEVSVGYFNSDDKQWYFASPGRMPQKALRVTHWMPLPTPPKGE